MTFNNFSDIFNELPKYLQTNIYESFNKVLKELTNGRSVSSRDFFKESFLKSLRTLDDITTRNDYTYNWKYNNTSLSNYNSTPVTTWVKHVCVNYQPTYSSKKVQKKYNKSFSNRYKQQNQSRTHHWK